MSTHAVSRRVIVFPALLLVALSGATGPSGAMWAQGLTEPFISEFLAFNDARTPDEDREFSDWLEIHNPLDAPVAMAGWALTDSPDQLQHWLFPDVTIGPKGFLTVFCSGKNRVVPTKNLHTNFRLEGSGEFLALVKPDGITIASQFTPKYVDQVPDYSYGPQHPLDRTVLLAGDGTGRYLVPVDANLALTWTATDFDAAAWTEGQAGFGFDANAAPALLPFIKTDLSTAMRTKSSTVYLRFAFEVADPNAFDLLQLQMRYKDGFVAYVNGREVARARAPASVAFNSRSATARPLADAVFWESFMVRDAKTTLRAGANVLAIHGLNDTAASPDFLVQCEVAGVKVGEAALGRLRYFETPTPGFPNGDGFEKISVEPLFLAEGGTFTTDFDLQITSAVPGAEIRYTMDGKTPDRGSTQYTGPITVSSTRTIKARLFEPGKLPSLVSSETYVKVDAKVLAVKSKVPIVVINTLGKAFNDSTQTPAHVMIFERGDNGEAALADEPQFSGIGAFKIRGSSTGGAAKASWSLEFRDADGQDLDVTVLGLPTQSDYVMHAPYEFDRALIRNPIMYDLSLAVGQWAARSRFVEVYLNTKANAVVLPADYYGVYSFMEKIKRDKNRVDVEELLPTDNAEPEVSGGYMLKIDRLDPGDAGINAAGQTMGLVYPKERGEISAAQKAWITKYFNDFGRALNGAQFANPETGYAKYVGVDSWIDHHLLNVLAKNVDALRLSAYFYKPRGGKIEFGPIWDFDRSIDSTDGRDDDPRSWNGTGDGTPFFTYPWWQRLFADPAFTDRYRARWRALRKDELATVTVDGMIEAMRQELDGPAQRNFGRWTISSAAQWPREMDKVKTWLKARSEWIDLQYIVSPVLSHKGGRVTAPFSLTIEADGLEILYTLTGADPRAAGNKAHADAIVYTGPIEITKNTAVKARSRVGATNWSTQMAQGAYVTDPPALAVTEIHFQPAAAALHEFVEIFNFGDKPVALAGAALTQAVTFAFPTTVEPIQPGERIVVVGNTAEFVARYGDGVKIVGQFTGTFADGGETLTFTGPALEPIATVAFQGLWYPEAAGGGYSLTLRDPKSDPATWSSKDAWDVSVELGGSPGKADVGTKGRRLPGDVTQDGRLSVSDAIGVLRFLFAGAGAALPCGDGSAADAGNVALLSVNGDAAVDVADAVYLLDHLFRAGPGPTSGNACVRISGCAEACTR